MHSRRNLVPGIVKDDRCVERKEPLSSTHRNLVADRQAVFDYRTIR